MNTLEELEARLQPLVQAIYGGCCHNMNETPHPADITPLQMQTVYANAFIAAAAAAIVASGKGVSQKLRAETWDGYISLFIHNLNEKDKILEDTVPGHTSISVAPEGMWDDPNET